MSCSLVVNMKVYVKTKYNNIVKQSIPHSKNFAYAMYGFLELGVEVVFYENVQEIENDFTSDDILIDYIDECRYILKKFGVEPKFDTYPTELSKYLKRKIWFDNINSFSSNPDKFTKGYFIKPVKEKVFTGHICSSSKDLVGCGNEYENYEIIVSEPINFQSEYRCFVYYNTLLDIKPYVIDKHNLTIPDTKTIHEIINEGKKLNVNAYSLDIGVDDKERTLLIECNDAYALGCYGLNPVEYAKFISARWAQLLGRGDELHF